MKQRLDRFLVETGRVESREKAQALIMAGKVIVNGVKAAKAGQNVSPDVAIEIVSPPPYVGRGGLKLEAALAHFQIDPTDRVCLDVGSSTGGFTDCLLQHGARRVHALDVGTGQLDWTLRKDTRVVVHEGINARYLPPAEIVEPVDIIVCDVSFISVTLILPALQPLFRPPETQLVILIKPQFEAGKDEVGKGGIVRDPEVHAAACDRVEGAVRQFGFTTGIIESPILGAEGNKEFLLYARY